MKIQRKGYLQVKKLAFSRTKAKSLRPAGVVSQSGFENEYEKRQQENSYPYPYPYPTPYKQNINYSPVKNVQKSQNEQYEKLTRALSLKQ